MREQEMASVHFLETRSRVSEDRYALGDLKQCMMLSQRHPSRSRVIQKEASVNFRSRIPALATLCVPSLPRPLLTFVNLRQHSAILKKQLLYLAFFPGRDSFPFSSQMPTSGWWWIPTLISHFHTFLLMPLWPPCPFSLKTFHSANYLL